MAQMKAAVQSGFDHHLLFWPQSRWRDQNLQKVLAALAEDGDLTLSTPTVRLAEEEALMARKLEQADLIVVSTGVVFGPEGTTFLKPITVVIPYDQKLVQASGLTELELQVYGWDPDKQKWIWLSSVVDPASRTVSGKTKGFGLFKVVGRKKQE